MAIPRLLVGWTIYIDPTTKHCDLLIPVGPEGFRDYPGTLVSSDLPSGVPSSYKWLPYHPGEITTTELDNDVLTGPMSGCPIAVYHIGGGTKVAHIGTTDVDAQSRDVKERWRAFATDRRNQEILGFNPFRALGNVAIPASQTGENPAPEYWGLITVDKELFGLMVYAPMYPPAARVPYRIVWVQDVPSEIDAAVRNWGFLGL
jgi:hypothetical protein